MSTPRGCWQIGALSVTSAVDPERDLRRSRRGGYSRKFDREDAPFTRQVAGMHVAAQCFGGAGDDGQAQPRPGTSSGAANEGYEEGVCNRKYYY